MTFLLTLLIASAGADEPATLAWSLPAQPALHRVTPQWPEGAVASGKEVHCDAAVVLAADGTAGEISIDGCSARFVEASKAALRQWRWPAPPSATLQQTARLRLRFNTPSHALTDAAALASNDDDSRG